MTRLLLFLIAFSLCSINLRLPSEMDAPRSQELRTTGTVRIEREAGGSHRPAILPQDEAFVGLTRSQRDDSPVKRLRDDGQNFRSPTLTAREDVNRLLCWRPDLRFGLAVRNSRLQV